MLTFVRSYAYGKLLIITHYMGKMHRQYKRYITINIIITKIYFHLNTFWSYWRRLGEKVPVAY